MKHYQEIVKNIALFVLDKLQRQLPPHLYYHGSHHTFDVYRAIVPITAYEHINIYDQVLLQVAALYHDTGFIVQYHRNEPYSCDIARADLPQFGFSPNDIAAVCQLIMATQMPQQPQNLLEGILCDADLDYLGRTDFEQIAHTLFLEINHWQQPIAPRQWHQSQIAFLCQHQYHTAYARQLREPTKQQNLQRLLDAPMP